MSLNSKATTKHMPKAAANEVSPNVPREIMDNKKVQRIANPTSTDHNQVLSAVEALLSLSPVMHQEEAAAAKQNETSVSTDKIVNLPYMPKPPSGTVSPCESSVGSHEESTSAKSFHDDDEEPQYYEGSCELWCPEDEECLSPLHCFMRKHCVEAFTAKAFDVSTPKFGRSLGRSIEIGQLGVQCKWCKHRNYSERQERAVCFPSTIKNIYHSIETWQRRHSSVCQDIPEWAKKEMTKLMECSRSGAGGRRLYWEESAKRMGMVDTDSGVRFIRPPGTVDPPTIKQVVEDMPPSEPVVRQEDKELQVTGYLFHLLDQMETCYFSEEDRIGGRSKVKSCRSGYPGLQCKHCGGKSGFGRYFPASCSALSSANSDRNVFNHLSKCRKCPQEVRDELSKLFKEQNKSKNRRGTRKVFFQRIWCRMHGVETPDEEFGNEPKVLEEPADPAESEESPHYELSDEEEFTVSTRNIREFAAATTQKRNLPVQGQFDEDTLAIPARKVRVLAEAIHERDFSTERRELLGRQEFTVSARKLHDVVAAAPKPVYLVDDDEHFAVAAHQSPKEFVPVAKHQGFVLGRQHPGFSSAPRHEFLDSQLAAQRHRQQLAAQQLATQHRQQVTAHQLASQHRRQPLVLSDQHHRPVMLQHQSLLMRSHPHFAVPPYMQQHQQRYMMQSSQQRAPRPMYMDPNSRMQNDAANATSV